jgi:hypothetical protein
MTSPLLNQEVLCLLTLLFQLLKTNPNMHKKKNACGTSKDTLGRRRTSTHIPANDYSALQVVTPLIILIN